MGTMVRLDHRSRRHRTHGMARPHLHPKRLRSTRQPIQNQDIMNHGERDALRVIGIFWLLLIAAIISGGLVYLIANWVTSENERIEDNCMARSYSNELCSYDQIDTQIGGKW
jgi:hypothetical protein